MNEMTIAPDVRQLIEESAAWRMFSLAFERPRNGWRDQVASIANELTDESVRSIAELAKEQATETLFLDILGPGGAISPREVAYRSFADPGHLLAELEAIYGAFAYEPMSEECPDHISVEAGFIGYLRMKQAFARIAGDEESEKVSSEAVEMFMKEHLGPIVLGVSKKLDEDDTFYIARATRLMRERIGEVPVAVEDGPADDDGDMTCGGGCPV